MKKIKKYYLNKKKQNKHKFFKGLKDKKIEGLKNKIIKIQNNLNIFYKKKIKIKKFNIFYIKIINKLKNFKIIKLNNKQIKIKTKKKNYYKIKDLIKKFKKIIKYLIKKLFNKKKFILIKSKLNFFKKITFSKVNLNTRITINFFNNKLLKKFIIRKSIKIQINFILNYILNIKIIKIFINIYIYIKKMQKKKNIGRNRHLIKKNIILIKNNLKRKFIYYFENNIYMKKIKCFFYNIKDNNHYIKLKNIKNFKYKLILNKFIKNILKIIIEFIYNSNIDFKLNRFNEFIFFISKFEYKPNFGYISFFYDVIYKNSLFELFFSKINRIIIN